MTPSDFEWRQERLEIEYLADKINGAEYRHGMLALGFSTELIMETLSDLDRAKADAR
jgi:hypothetical protein